MAAVRTAAILAVGSELLTQHRVDTNSLYLTGRLNDVGIDVVAKSVVGDSEGTLAAAIRHATAEADLVITTGGLGPTADDLTREVVASVLGLKLVEDARILETIRHRFERRGLHMPDGNRRQAGVPEGARVLPNPNGTAPGLWIENGGSILVLLPGPPREMQPMFDTGVLPQLAELSRGRRVLRRVIRIAGRPESHVEEIAHPIYSALASGDVPIETTILASPGLIELHLSARGTAESEMNRALDAGVSSLAAALAPAAFSTDGRTLEQVVGQELAARNWKVSVAESCTGGMLGARLTDVAGSSQWFAGGVIAYANDVKIHQLGVAADLIEKHGAVSEPVAVAMADGVRDRLGSNAGVAITGIAGPDGGSAEKPVGTVVVAVAAGPARVRTYRFVGDRAMVRQQSVIAALELLRRALLALPGRD
ncbi:MAG TPA: competence/damage-inducible protein A [Vicinamibacterales bacterium]|nr:competence/damage-inducible protein A [Vicinamibacterales bacterium]